MNSDATVPNQAPIVDPGSVRRHVVALGYQASDGTIVVTDVLCMNFPQLTPEQIGALSWQLTHELRLRRT